jgi:FMN phosphatase YigB (HAD superfamily)
MLNSGLEQFLAGYRFPAKKTVEVFESLIKELNIDPVTSWHIGNSIKSEINPARESGLNSILVGERGCAYDKDELREANTSFERVSQLCEEIPICACITTGRANTRKKSFARSSPDRRQ